MPRRMLKDAEHAASSPAQLTNSASVRYSCCQGDARTRQPGGEPMARTILIAAAMNMDGDGTDDCLTAPPHVVSPQ